jgi:hypothetical protein
MGATFLDIMAAIVIGDMSERDDFIDNDDKAEANDDDKPSWSLIRSAFKSCITSSINAGGSFKILSLNFVKSLETHPRRIDS